MRSVGVLLSSLGFVVLLACGGGEDSPPSNNPPRQSSVQSSGHQPVRRGLA